MISRVCQIFDDGIFCEMILWILEYISLVIMRFNNLLEGLDMKKLFILLFVALNCTIIRQPDIRFTLLSNRDHGYITLNFNYHKPVSSWQCSVKINNELYLDSTFGNYWDCLSRKDIVEWIYTFPVPTGDIEFKYSLHSYIGSHESYGTNISNSAFGDANTKIIKLHIEKNQTTRLKIIDYRQPQDAGSLSPIFPINPYPSTFQEVMFVICDNDNKN